LLGCCQLNSGQGSLFVWLTFTTRSDDDFNGAINWIKPASRRAKLYPAGFTEQINAIGSVYHRPPGANHVIDFANGQVMFSGGNLDSDFTNLVVMEKSGRIMNQSDNRLTLGFSPATGKFTGSVLPPSRGKPLPFSGIAFQRMNSAFGFMPGTDQSSSVIVA